MAHSVARSTSVEDIPVIDITPLRDGTDPKGVAKALHAASKGLGFIYVSGHGIPETVIEEARRQAYLFFHADEATKADVSVSRAHRGWIRQGGAKMRDDVKADLKESFVWGYESVDGSLPDEHPLRGQNKWPAAQPELKTIALDYFRHAHEVAHHLMRGFALGLDLPDDFFLRTANHPLSRCSFVWYPAQDPGSDATQFGVGPHTDFGVLTVLCQDNVGGLEVEDKNGEWIVAPPIPGTLLVNVADLLARWTDGEYKSTPHRVVNRSGRERLSLVLAFDPNPETLIDSRQIFGPSHMPQQDATTCGDYLIWRFGKAFAYRAA
ncbi:isopenicillin N synthase family dioxygenase [Rhizobium sp. G187]|uniref:isopenicillin N synthase family dioxygenase n=1 Tax=Rhizobium sp. G187 TaxID=3451352 RepID=UPI003EE46F62